MKNDVYQIIIDRIIRLLEAGTVPWHRPWKGGDQAPQNLVSRKAYRGINVFLLHAAGYPSPFWLTFRQAKSLGGSVKKGEHPFPVVFWKVLEEGEEDEKRRVPLLRYHSVFNVAQCEGIDVPSLEPTGDFHPIDRCEKVVADMPRRPEIRHGAERACYSPLDDTVTMPEARLFESPEAYYGTLFHELTHATGHQSRLARKEIVESNRFGSDPYSREELVAEMGAAFLYGHCAIETTTVEQSAGYIQSWLGRLKSDRKLVVIAAAQAQKACDFILNVQAAEDEDSSDKKPIEPSPAADAVAALPA
jgi:antirestriction protein ArdC